MKTLCLLFLITLPVFAEVKSPAPAPIIFGSQKAACTLIDGKLTLAKMWPLGSWEECAYSILDTAKRLDLGVQQLQKEVQELQAKKK